VKKHATLIPILLGLALISSAKSSKLAYTWRNPNYSGSSFKNVLVLAMNGHSSGRLDFEDRMVERLARPGLQAVPSYSLLPRPESTPIQMDQLKSVVRDQKFDAILVSRLVKYDKTTTYVPGQAYPLYPYYGTFYGYYGALYPVVYSPGYLRTDTSAQIETNLYSTAKPDGELVWTGTSNTVNPKSVSKAIDDVVDLIAQQLEKENIIESASSASSSR
jgi:hypothetical protein